MTLAAKLCEHKTFVLTSLKKCDFNDSNNEHQHVPPVQHSLVPVHHQVTVRRWFLRRTEFWDCCLQVWLAVVFPENKQNKRFP